MYTINFFHGIRGSILWLWNMKNICSYSNVSIVMIEYAKDTTCWSSCFGSFFEISTRQAFMKKNLEVKYLIWYTWDWFVIKYQNESCMFSHPSTQRPKQQRKERYDFFILVEWKNEHVLLLKMEFSRKENIFKSSKRIITKTSSSQNNAKPEGRRQE